MTIPWLRALETQGPKTPNWVPQTQATKSLFANSGGGLSPAPSMQALRAQEHTLRQQQALLAAQLREVDALRLNYEQALQALAAAKAEITRASAEEATELALAVGRELAQRELSSHPHALADVVRSLLADVGGEATTVRLSPSDAARLQDDLKGVAIISDDTLEPGSALVQNQEASIDARFDERTRRVREALGLKCVPAQVKLARVP